MRKLRLKGIVGVITGKIGKTHFFRTQEWPLMNVDELKILINEGWEIASHSVTHPTSLDKLPPNKFEFELTESKKWLEKTLGVDVIKFVVPHERCLTSNQLETALQHYKFVRHCKQYYNCNGHRVFHVVAENEVARFCSQGVKI